VLSKRNPSCLSRLVHRSAFYAHEGSHAPFFFVFKIAKLVVTSFTGNARALTDEGQSRSPPIDLSFAQTQSTSSLQPPSPNGTSTSPSRRISLTPGGTTKVLADLQTGVVNARNALENTRAQLRLSQRSVAQLTRQTEDLKEGRERVRLENEGLNNVVARKERLLQEVRSTLRSRNP
jgi:hypothetical protein